MRRWHWFMLLLCCAPVPGNTVFSYGEDVSKLFEQGIAPIFEQRCVGCHNDRQKKGGLSLESREAFLAGGDSGAIVTLGDPNSSYLVDMVSPRKDAPPEMPKNGVPLTADQIDALRKWIAMGAPWPEGRRLVASRAWDANWWSLRPLVRPKVPDLSEADASWVRTPIDAFVLDQLRRHGLSPSAEADRRTLIRRLYFDLLGLPPTAEEVQAFLEDPDPAAYERLVERVLASPRYGERWARHWLDVVHYADTHGYDKDKPRPNAWPYRDYVIRAFNSDKPYGQFVKEQIAGDVLFPNTADGIVALGFLAAGPWDFISHVEVPEEKIDGRLARSLDRDDMVRNVMETFNSVTIGCARCHDHKFDPFSQQDYYALQAVFAAVDRADRPYDGDPQVAAERLRLQEQIATLERERADIEDAIAQRVGHQINELDRQINALLDELLKNAPAEFGYHSALSKQPDTEKWVQVDLGQKTCIREILLQPCYDSFNNIGAGFGFPPRYRVEVSDDPDFHEQVQVVLDRTERDFPNPGLAPVVIKLSDVKARYVRVCATRLAHRKDDYIFALAELMVFDDHRCNVAKGGAVTALDTIEAPVRWSVKNLTDGKFPGGEAPEALQQQVAALFRERSDLRQHAVSAEESQRLASVEARLSDLRSALESLPPPGLVYAAATHFQEYGNFRPTQGRPRRIHVLHRGNILQPGEEVQPGVPAVLAHLDRTFAEIEAEDESARRAALAHWLADPAHPLTWRSIANRLWHYHFGRGIVDTPNDFGQRGATPSHPELLDWLACELREGEQSLKRIHRLICTSAVYRQTSDSRPDAAKIDGENRWLWRMNRRRLEAEALRDAILFVAGRLDETMYGPGYQDFVIERPEHSPHYEYHLHDPNDPKSHRRTIYRFIVRSQPQPFLTTWDCADPSMQVDKRNETITPLQSLALWNNSLTVRMSSHFAARVRSASDTLEGQLDAAFGLAFGRRPTAEERAVLSPYIQQYGWENACRVIFNSNEFLFID